MGNVCSSLCNSKETNEVPNQNKGNTEQPATKSTKSKGKNETTENDLTSQSGSNTDVFKYGFNSQKNPTGESQSGQVKRPVTGNSSKISTDDFDFLKYLGKGAYGKVALVKKKTTGSFYAMKIVKKKDFALNRITIENAMSEREVLMKSHHPFVVKLKYSFQDSTSIYFVMDYVAGGQLFDYLKKMGKFDLTMTRFYAAEVLLGLKHLHDDLDTIYRDLKPENIFLTADLKAKIGDFG